MGSGYKRSDLRASAEAKLSDAVVLLRERRFANAYYLAGYAVELGLKACVARQIRAETIPDPDLLKRLLTHDIGELVNLAGLRQELKVQQDVDTTFHAYWGIVSTWSPDSRYEDTDSMSAQYLVQAISDPTSGVLAWIKKHW